jgi:putative copper resistance protein D
VQTLYVLCVWLHLVAVAVWLGALVALAFAVLPTARRLLDERAALGLIATLGERLRPLTWAAFAVLAVTGVVQVLLRVEPNGLLLEAGFWSAGWGRLLAVKLGLFVALLALAGVHDFRLGPRAADVARSDPRSPERLALRRRAAWIGRIEFALSLVIVLYGVMLVRGSL